MFIVMACPRQISGHDFQLTVDILGETKRIFNWLIHNYLYYVNLVRFNLYACFPILFFNMPNLKFFPSYCANIYIYILLNLPNASKIIEFLSLLFWQCLGNANINIRIVLIFIIWVLGKHILCFKTQNILNHFNIVNIHNISIMNTISWLFIIVTILKSN